MLEDADDKLTRQEILAEWPPDYARPVDSTLYVWLERAVGLGLVCKEGVGKKTAPFRYWLPEKASAWAEDPMHQLDELMRKNSAWVREQMRGKR